MIAFPWFPPLANWHVVYSQLLAVAPMSESVVNFLPSSPYSKASAYLVTSDTQQIQKPRCFRRVKPEGSDSELGAHEIQSGCYTLAPHSLFLLSDIEKLKAKDRGQRTLPKVLRTVYAGPPKISVLCTTNRVMIFQRHCVLHISVRHGLRQPT